MAKTGLSNIIDYNKLDIEGIKKLILPKCMMCDVEKRIKVFGNQCDDCVFILHSKSGKIGCGKEFRKYGIINPAELGRHQAIYFNNHPELKYSWPRIPDFDIFGQTNKKLLWHLHHLNGIHTDDRIINLLLCLNTEHSFLGKLTPNLVNHTYFHMIFENRLKMILKGII